MLPHDTSIKSIFHPERWGLPCEAIDSLTTQYRLFFERFRGCFRTQTHNGWHHAWTYLKGLLLLPSHRTFANIARRVLGIKHDGQNLQQFMSDSPWDGQEIFSQIQDELKADAKLHHGCLLLDDSGDKCEGAQKAGAARQYIGRLGKQDNGVVGVSLSYYHHQQRLWSMVDAELFIPESWFKQESEDKRKRCGIPDEREYLKKPELGLQMIEKAKARGLNFEAVCTDSIYGRDRTFRRKLRDQKILYMADTVGNNKVYLRKPKVGVPKAKGGRGRKPTRKRPLSKSRSIASVPRDIKLDWKDVFVRYGERGEQRYQCTAKRVWTYHEEKLCREWLFIWKYPDGSYKYSMSNAIHQANLEKLAFWRAARYFVERDYQDAKSEAGWDELEARKYLAWCHHTALCALALWFVSCLKLDWKEQWPQDESLKSEFGIEQLPELSMANIRELLQAVMPLHQLSPREASVLVAMHLANRSLSTASRRKKQKAKGQTSSPEFDDSS